MGRITSVLLRPTLTRCHAAALSTASSSSQSSQSSTLLPSAPLPDYYAVLDSDPSTPLPALKAAYYALALRYHPDRTAQRYSADAARWSDRRFRLLSAAWRTLSDPVRRRQYDTQRLLNAVGDTHRMQHWLRLHRPPEELAPPPPEMAEAVKGGHGTK